MVGVTAASGIPHCDLHLTFDKQSNGGRIEVEA